jgi:MoxR-like ATPase
MSGRTEAILSDLWVLRYIWDTEEQIELINGMVNSVIEKEDKGPVHPRAMNSKAPDAEELIKEIESLHGRWDNESTDLEERNIIKDKLRYLQNRSQWISHPEHKSHLQEHIDSLWQKMLTEA